MNPASLFEPPFTDFHSSGLDGLFQEADADGILTLVQSFNQGAGYGAA